MLHVFGFGEIGVVVSDLYFVDPRPGPGQEGPEQGVRVELRRLVRGDLPGSIYSAVPITIDAPLWRVDLLESVARPGSLDRAHHHPRFRGWEPGGRRFDDELSADPVAWLEAELRDLDRVLSRAGLEPTAVGPGDAEELRRATPEIIAVVRRSLAGVVAGELGHPTDPTPEAGARAGWL